MSNRMILLSAAILAPIALCVPNADAQPTAVDNELQRLNGHWRVIEMVEDGRAIPENQMREALPGGGALEIIDYTILFKSPLDGSKSTKRLRLDASSYPKQIAIMDRDTLTGAGIYKFDQGKLILCVTRDTANFPTEFSASKGTERTLIVLQRFDPGRSEIPGMNTPLPARPPVQASPVNQVSARVELPNPPVVAAPQPPTPSPPQPIVAGTAAGRVLSDAQVRAMAVGTWRMTDGEGSIDIVLQPNGAFRTFRYTETMANFHVVFVPTPVSTGAWSVVNGRLTMTVAASTRLDKVNQVYAPSVRSISATDAILEDHLGRVTRAVKTK